VRVDTKKQEQKMAKQRKGILREVRDKAAYQLRGFPCEFKHQVRGVG
jgi:hypothetical protein